MKSKILRWLFCLLASPLAALILIVVFGILFGAGADAAPGISEPGKSIVFSKRYVIVGLALLVTGGIFSYLLKARIFPGGLVFGLVLGAATGSLMISLMALIDYDGLLRVLAGVFYTMLGVCMSYGFIGGFLGSGLYKLIHRE